MRRTNISFLFSLILCGCIITPHSKKTFDESCNEFRKKVTLEADWVKLRKCNNTNRCVGEVGFGVLLGAVSGVISIAIMVVGNTYYAIDEMGSCKVQLDTKKIKNLESKKYNFN